MDATHGAYADAENNTSKNIKLTRMQRTVSLMIAIKEIIVKVKLLSSLKQTDLHICAKFAKNRYLKY